MVRFRILEHLPTQYIIQRKTIFSWKTHTYSVGDFFEYIEKAHTYSDLSVAEKVMNILYKEANFKPKVIKELP